MYCFVKKLLKQYKTKIQSNKVSVWHQSSPLAILASFLLCPATHLAGRTLLPLSRCPSHSGETGVAGSMSTETVLGQLLKHYTTQSTQALNTIPSQLVSVSSGRSCPEPGGGGVKRYSTTSTTVWSQPRSKWIFITCHNSAPASVFEGLVCQSVWLFCVA